MNKYEVVNSIADGNAGRFRPFRDMDQVDEYGLIPKKIPFFKIARDSSSMGRYRVHGFNYEGHDNAPRMGFYCQWLQDHVLPNVSPDVDATGIYPIELHDTYSYLDDTRRDFYVKHGGLTFSKNMDDKRPVLVPDPYMIANYGGKLAVRDERDWSNKKSLVSFAGSTTGDMDPSKNLRLRVAHWSSSDPDIASFTRIGITNIVQMPESAVLKCYGIEAMKKMMMQSMTQQEQCENRYILSIDGNTSCWDRLMWIANSKSLLMKYTSKEINWNYPLCIEGQHYVDVDMTTLKTKFQFLESNPSLTSWIVSNANHFASTYANSMAALHYTVRLIESIAANKD